MHEVGSVSDVRIGRVDAEAQRPKSRVQPQTPETIERQNDRVDVSPMARYLSELRDLPEIRADLVERVRAEIQSGEYLTDARLDHAIDALRDDLSGGLI